MKFKSILFVILMFFVHSVIAEPYLILSLPGESVEKPENIEIATYLQEKHWYAATLKNQMLIIDPVSAIKPSDILTRTYSVSKASSTHSSSLKKPEFQPDGIALDLPHSALFAFRIEGAGGKNILIPGAYPSVIPSGEILTKSWEKNVSIGGERWTISAEHELRPDGVMLAGSMSLVATNAAGQSSLLVPPAHGMAFIRQEILWLGDLDKDHYPDLILKRTWVTGEVDYVLVIGSILSYVYEDPDRPGQLISSGVEETEEEIQHISQKFSMSIHRFGKSAFSISESDWNASFDRANRLPKLIMDRTLQLDGETIRFTVEYLPRYFSETNRTTVNARSSDGPLLVRVHFRGQSQILMQADVLDGGPFRVQVDTIEGEPAIEIFHQPHYNNGMSYYWVWGTVPRPRFQRRLIYQSQGC